MKEISVFKTNNAIIVGDDSLKFDFVVPEVFPENFFYLLWWERDNKFSYFTIEGGDVNKQTEHVLEPTEENYNKFVKPFVDQWEAEKERLAPTEEELKAQQEAEALAQAKAERAEAVSKIVVEVDGMKFDGDEPAQTRMGRTIAAAIALCVDIQTYTQTWVLADNTVAQVTIAQLAQALKLAGEAQTALWIVPYENSVP